jgi:hypothetical protein
MTAMAASTRDLAADHDALRACRLFAGLDAATLDLVADGVLHFDGDDLVIPDATRLAAASRR